MKQSSMHTPYLGVGSSRNGLGSAIRKEQLYTLPGNQEDCICKLMPYTVGYLPNYVEGICGAVEVLKFCGGGCTRFPIARPEDIGLARKCWGKGTCKT